MTKILVDKTVIERVLEALVVAEEFVDRHSEDWYISVQKDLKQIREAITDLREALAEQAEQEPDYFGLTHDHTWLSIDKKQYDKLKPEGRMTCYAAPVRTKDLTDDEIREMFNGYVAPETLLMFRAVIAADREKNK